MKRALLLAPNLSKGEVEGVRTHDPRPLPRTRLDPGGVGAKLAYPRRGQQKCGDGKTSPYGEGSSMDWGCSLNLRSAGPRPSRAVLILASTEAFGSNPLAVNATMLTRVTSWRLVL